MSGNGNKTHHFDPVMQPFVEFWSSYVKEADETAREYFEALDGNEGMKTWQRRWFAAVSKSMDAYMRSPAFLQAMKHNTELAIKTKRQADDLVAEAARNLNIPTATDISGLFERLHSVEEVMLARLGRIEDRLQGIEERLKSGAPGASGVGRGEQVPT